MLALLGFYLFWKNHPLKRSLLIWPVLFCLWTLVIWIHRPVWYYLIFFEAFFSMFVGYELILLFKKYFKLNTRYQGIYLTIGLLVIHHLSVWGGLNSRLYDCGMYRRWIKPYYEARNNLQPQEHIAVIHNDSRKTKIDFLKRLEHIHPYHLTYNFIDSSSKLFMITHGYYINIKSSQISSKSEAELITYFDSLNVKAIIDERGSYPVLQKR